MKIMKKINKFFTITTICALIAVGCETTDLDLRVSPNDLAADQADPNLVLNSVQLAFAENQRELNNQAAALT